MKLSILYLSVFAPLTLASVHWVCANPSNEWPEPNCNAADLDFCRYGSGCKGVCGGGNWSSTRGYALQLLRNRRTVSVLVSG
ncbi:hypothetical protein E2P81_ATG00368 [Venturia nashicola]|nr:hypothetical protein E2P81_ATG00368 [Venturia nashicola]